MKRYLYIILFALLGVSCDTVIDDIIGAELVEICVIADAEECESRVNVDGNTTKWEVGDRITLFLTNFSTQTIELEIKSSADISNDGKRAMFRGSVPTGNYYGVTAFYPAVSISEKMATLDRSKGDNIFMMSEIMDEYNPVLSVKAGQNVELPLTFEHLMHKMDFNITLGKSVAYDEIAVTMSATSNGTQIKFVNTKSYNLTFHRMTDTSSVSSITVSGNTPKLSTMLFPMSNTEGVVFNFDVYIDGVKRYHVQKPESGMMDNFAMHAGMTTVVNLDFGSNQEAECRAEMDCNIDAKGIIADVNLTNIAYMVGNEPQSINVIKIEYSPKSSEQWAGYEFSGSEIKSGALSKQIPFGTNYLTENSNYKLRVTLYPQNGDYEPITSEVYAFKTKYAEVTAEISKPTVSVNSGELRIKVDNVRTYFDGIDLPNYGDTNYCFYYRKSDSTAWSTPITAKYNNASMSLTLSLSEFEAGATYEFCGGVITGAERKTFTSETTSVTIPKGETPTPPTGDIDTSTIAGDWQLTSWRGAAPSFDVYLSITEDGVVTIYQRMTSRLWETYYSTVEFEDGIISGVYTDGVTWGASYAVSYAGETMTWTDTKDSTDVSIYTRCTLPDFTNITRATATSSERFL